MSQPPAMTPAVRQAVVRQLIEQDPTLSARKIAGQIGVGKDTVLRDLAEIRQAQEQPAPETGAAEPEPAPETPDIDEDDAPRGAQHEPPPTPDAPPDADCLTVALDDQLRHNLAVLAEAGHTHEDAVRLAVAVLARAYTGAWKWRLYPQGVAPRVRCVQLQPYYSEGHDEHRHRPDR